MNPEIQSPQPLKQLALAALLGWLLPGLGHLYLGRKFKGVMFLVLVNGLFLSGWIMSSGEAMSLHKDDGHRYAFLAEVGVGGAAMLSLVYTHFPEIVSGFDEDVVADYAQRREDTYQTPQYYSRLPWMEVGLLYCMVAGLLNLLIIYEAATGARGLPKSASTKQSKQGEQSGDAPADAEQASS